MRIIKNKASFKKGFERKLKSFIKDNFPAVFQRLEVVFVSDETMRRYNKRYTGSHSVTDVLAFDMEEAYIVIVCTDVARRSAILYGERYEDELVLYVIHGILHIIGYDHKVEGKERSMREMERNLIHKWKTLYYS